MSHKRRANFLLRYQKDLNRNLLASPGEHEFVVVLDSLKSSYNIPKIFRSAEAFGAREVHLVNTHPFDPSPAKGSFRKVPARFHETFDECRTALLDQGYELFLLDPAGEVLLSDSILPRRSAFIFGHEEWGFSFDPAACPDIRRISIPQFGQVQSLNVSIAASIVMYEYVRQHRS